MPRWAGRVQLTTSALAPTRNATSDDVDVSTDLSYKTDNAVGELLHRRTQDFTMEGVAMVDTRVWFGCDMASAEREYITGVWQSPKRGLVGKVGEAPRSLSFFRPWTTKVKFRTLSAYIINHCVMPTVELTTTIIST